MDYYSKYLKYKKKYLELKGGSETDIKKHINSNNETNIKKHIEEAGSNHLIQQIKDLIKKQLTNV